MRSLIPTRYHISYIYMADQKKKERQQPKERTAGRFIIKLKLSSDCDGDERRNKREIVDPVYTWPFFSCYIRVPIYTLLHASTQNNITFSRRIRPSIGWHVSLSVFLQWWYVHSTRQQRYTIGIYLYNYIYINIENIRYNSYFFWLQKQIEFIRGGEAELYEYA